MDFWTRWNLEPGFKSHQIPEPGFQGDLGPEFVLQIVDPEFQDLGFRNLESEMSFGIRGILDPGFCI